MHDIIIVGGGPAGLTAAVYALRAGKTVLVVEKAGFGGQIAFSPKVENIPGTKLISGTEFADQLTDQAMALGADVELEILMPEAQAQPFLDKLTDMSAGTIEGMMTGQEYRAFPVT